MDTPDDNSARSLRCPAKLNLTLAVGSPRADGLHPIASVMVALDFGDDLHLHRLDDGPSTYSRHFADDAPKPQPIDWPIERDLIFRAHAMLEQTVGRSLPVACAVDKRIPAGAWLGGGSSDAAGVLVGLRSLFDLSITDDALLSIVQSLGADVTFLVHALLGQTAALVTGIGEVIEPIDTLPPFDAVLVFPDGACPTSAVYQAFDQGLAGTQKDIPSELVTSWTASGRLPSAQNDLTEAAATQCPAITTTAHAITSHGLEPRLTGSGSCVFALVESKQEAVAIAEELIRDGLHACTGSYSALSSAH